VKIRTVVVAGLLIALGLLLPFFTGQIPSVGNALLPMHLPVLLCGFLLGGPIGFVVGFILPMLRSVLFGMPPLYPVAIAMSFELATYGFVTGFLYRKLPSTALHVFVSLIGAMLAGRIVWGLAMLALLGVSSGQFTIQMFIGGAFVNSVPGLLVQIVIIPVLVIALKKANLIKQ
jgi:riboflavin transporter FmnP